MASTWFYVILHLHSQYMESVAKVKTIIQLGNRNVNFKYGCKLFA